MDTVLEPIAEAISNLVYALAESEQGSVSTKYVVNLEVVESIKATVDGKPKLLVH